MSEPAAWQELEDVFSGLSQLARTDITPEDFYAKLLEESVRALSAAGAAVWLRGTGGAWRPAAQIAWPTAVIRRSDESRRAHESLLTEAALRGTLLTVGPQSANHNEITGNPTEHALLLAPVQAPIDDTPAQPSGASLRIHDAAAGTTVAIIEFLVRSDASPTAYRGYEQYLTAVCELAADHHTFSDLRRLRREDDYRARLLELGRLAHRQLELTETAYTVVNEGRRVLTCDRLSVLVDRGRGCRLLATSGVGRVERRSGVARRLEQVAELVRRTDEPAFYADGQCDGLPPVAEALEQHAEESHARQIAALPLRRPNVDTDEASRRSRLRQRQSQPLIVLIAEQFNAEQGAVDRDRLMEVGEVVTTAMYNALEVSRQPLRWLFHPLGRAVRQVTDSISRALLIATILAGLIAALVFLPADFNIEAPGTLQPAVRRDVFAPRGGLVDEVLVKHGADVTAGQPLVRLRDPSLELELKRVRGELDTAQRQIDAVRATRTNRAVRDANPTDAYRLSAEERELDQRLSNLRRELELLDHEREELVVESPIAGRVLTWDLGHRLVARPVERGEVLLTVADLAADWQLELDVPDDRIGHVMAAQPEIQTDLPVKFRLSSDDREQHSGHISEVCMTASVNQDQNKTTKPTVLVKVALDSLKPRDKSEDDLRPGVSARAQIDCGRRPLGYVWLHDIWDAAIGWLRY